jgi:hypothetical protein
LIGARLVNGGVVLRGEKDIAVARTELGRPILNATLVNGKMTTSRIGTIGNREMSVGIWSVNSCIVLELFRGKFLSCLDKELLALRF